MAKGKELAQSQQDECVALEAIVREHSLQTMNTAEVFAPAVRLSQGLQALREQISEEFMQQVVMPLQGSRLGFRTDKDTGQGYPVAVVKEVFIEATLRGLRPVGNEFNIIANNLYVTREGLTRLLRDYPGLTDLDINPEPPRAVAGDKGATVKFKASWKIDGVPNSLEGEIPVRINAGMGVDAILGKADRKIKHRIYNKITGSKSLLPTDGEVGDDVIETTGKTAPGGLQAGRVNRRQQRAEAQQQEAEPEGLTPEERDLVCEYADNALKGDAWTAHAKRVEQEAGEDAEPLDPDEWPVELQRAVLSDAKAWQEGGAL